MAAPAQAAQRTAREADESRPLHGVARLGHAGRGVLYLVVGLLAVRIAAGDGGRADPSGAFATIKHQHLGGVLLVLLALALAGYGVWQVVDGVAGDAEGGEARRAARRGASVARGLGYLLLAAWTAHFLVSTQSGDKTKALTARAMSLPGGQVVVAVVGAAVVGAGLFVAYRGLSVRFVDELEVRRMPAPLRRTAEGVGLVGLVGRGLVIALVGGFLVQAAVTFDPQKAKGLDAALKSLAAEPYGTYLLAAAALGLVAFGCWSFLQAGYGKVGPRS